MSLIIIKIVLTLPKKSIESSIFVILIAFFSHFIQKVILNTHTKLFVKILTLACMFNVTQFHEVIEMAKLSESWQFGYKVKFQPFFLYLKKKNTVYLQA